MITDDTTARAAAPTTPRFAQPDATPISLERAGQLLAGVDPGLSLIPDLARTTATLYDENARLQAAIDTHLGKCAELRGLVGQSDARARTAETLLNQVDLETIPDVELRARIAAFKAHLSAARTPAHAPPQA